MYRGLEGAFDSLSMRGDGVKRRGRLRATATGGADERRRKAECEPTSSPNNEADLSVDFLWFFTVDRVKYV